MRVNEISLGRNSLQAPLLMLDLLQQCNKMHQLFCTLYTDINPGGSCCISRRVLSTGRSGASIKLAAREAAFESCCLVYICCYQEAGSKVGIYNTAAWIPQQ